MEQHLYSLNKQHTNTGVVPTRKSCPKKVKSVSEQVLLKVSIKTTPKPNNSDISLKTVETVALYAVSMCLLMPSVSSMLMAVMNLVKYNKNFKENTADEMNLCRSYRALWNIRLDYLRIRHYKTLNTLYFVEVYANSTLFYNSNRNRSARKSTASVTV